MRKTTNTSTPTRRFISHLTERSLRQVVDAAEVALYGRDNDTLVRIAGAGNGPLFSFYRAVLLNRTGYREESETIAKELIDAGPPEIQARALVLLANNYSLQDPGGALRLYDRAGRLALDATTALAVIKMRAVVLGVVGRDHPRALAHLESAVRLLPSIPQSHPLVAEFLNAVAVECTEMGYLEQARKLSSFAVSSVWAPRFPEWTETAADERLLIRPLLIGGGPRRAELRLIPCPPRPAGWVEPETTHAQASAGTAQRMFTKRMDAHLVVDLTESEPVLDVVISLGGASVKNACIGSKVISGPPLSAALGFKLISSPEEALKKSQ